MPRRMTPSQFKSKMRQIERNINREIKKVNDHNRRVVNEYNRKVRAHNTRVRQNRARLQREIARLNAQPVSTRYVTYRTSVQTLQRSFTQVEQASEQERWFASDDLFEMAEGETANSVAVLNALMSEPKGDLTDDPRLRQTVITTELAEISPDLDARWRGAIYSLSPLNPDAARQFCTSSREIFVRLLDLRAPDAAVMAWDSDVDLMERVLPPQVPRRDKIRYCAAQSGQDSPELVSFADDDIDNIMELFKLFNPATHGEAGRYDLEQLGAMKTRVEQGIQFLHKIMKFDA